MTDYNDTIDKVKESLKAGSSPRRYICEVHREIYDLVERYLPEEEMDNALNIIAEAYWYGKRMSDRLKELKEDFYEETPDNPNFDSDLERRAERIGLLKQIKSVNIETIDFCDRKCEWCPNKDRRQSIDNIMTEDVFCRIIRQLMDYAYKGEIHPFLNGEPTLDDRITKFTRYAKDHLPDCTIKLFTNGARIKTKEDVKALFGSGVDNIHYNHYDDRLAGIEKARDSEFTNLTHVGMKALLPSFYNRAGKVDFKPEKTVDKCEFFLNKLVFNYKGDVILCCSDFNSEVVFGNIMEQPLSTIMGSELYQKYHRAHKDGKAKTLPLCKKCNRLS